MMATTSLESSAAGCSARCHMSNGQRECARRALGQSVPSRAKSRREI